MTAPKREKATDMRKRSQWVGDNDDYDSAYGSRLTGYTDVVQRNASQQELNRMGMDNVSYRGARPDGDGGEALEAVYMNQNVHVCTSATCPICVGQQGSSRGVQFIRSTLPGDESTLTSQGISNASSSTNRRGSQSSRSNRGVNSAHDTVSL